MSGQRDPLPGGPLNLGRFGLPEELQAEPDRPRARWPRVLAVGLAIIIMIIVMGRF